MVLPFITISHSGNSTTYSQSGKYPDTARKRCNTGETNYLAIGLWSLYAVVTLVLAIRFFSNIITILSKMKTNTPIDYKNAKLILVPEKILPHTFLNTIFINETEYNNREIEAELYTRTHACNSKHTLDILFIELLKTVFGSTLFYFLQKSHTTQPRISCR
jgi:hypothetical protein